MKCCGSPITFTVPNAAPDASGSSREAAAQFAALLFASAFKPLSKALGFYGDAVVASAAQALARSEHGGLTDRLERLIEAGGRDGRAA